MDKFLDNYKIDAMNLPKSSKEALTYPLRAAARLTGLSPDLLRAWERRHRVVEPQRSPGGTRRYTAADVERLRLVKAAVDAGNRVGKVARLDEQELERLVQEGQSAPKRQLDTVFAALEKYDVAEFQRLLSIELSSLGATRFAREVAAVVLVEVGERWASGQIAIAQEHLATSVIRSLIGSALQPSAVSIDGPRIIFATPPSEYHELGLMMAALTSLGAGANPYFLGTSLPVDEIVKATEKVGAQFVALSLVTSRIADAQSVIDELRSLLDDSVQIWLGGVAAADISLQSGVEHIENFEALERRVTMLRHGSQAVS